MFRRKIYDTLLSWKKESDGHTALLIEGARRVGKSTVVEEFGKNEYESYILIDFSIASRAVREHFRLELFFSAAPAAVPGGSETTKVVDHF